MIRVNAVKAFKDNYIWVLTDPDVDAASCTVVDPGDATPVIDYVSSRGLRVACILVTHHHFDHCGGAGELAEQFAAPVYGPASETIPTVTAPLREGDSVAVPSLDATFSVFDIPGHTAGHIAFTGHGLLFCGDTLFAAGCGRLFEGTAEQMYESLRKLAGLPPETRVYCGHEYTQANLRFARRVEPGNADIANRLEKVDQLRSQGEITLPSDIGCELKTNPFLRVHTQSVIESAEMYAQTKLSSPGDVLGAIRAWKNASG